MKRPQNQRSLDAYVTVTKRARPAPAEPVLLPLATLALAGTDTWKTITPAVLDELVAYVAPSINIHPWTTIAAVSRDYDPLAVTSDGRLVLRHSLVHGRHTTGLSVVPLANPIGVLHKDAWRYKNDMRVPVCATAANGTLFVSAMNSLLTLWKIDPIGPRTRVWDRRVIVDAPSWAPRVIGASDEWLCVLDTEENYLYLFTVAECTYVRRVYVGRRETLGMRTLSLHSVTELNPQLVIGDTYVSVVTYNGVVVYTLPELEPRRRVYDSVGGFRAYAVAHVAELLVVMSTDHHDRYRREFYCLDTLLADATTPWTPIHTDKPGPGGRALVAAEATEGRDGKLYAMDLDGHVYVQHIY